jgi:hypothetical protein
LIRHYGAASRYSRSFARQDGIPKIPSKVIRQATEQQ